MMNSSGRMLSVTLALLAGLILTPAVARADFTVAGDTYQSAFTAPDATNGPTVDSWQDLTFTAASFSDVIHGSDVISLGTFNLDPGIAVFDGTQGFNLVVNFSLPAGTARATFGGDIFGAVVWGLGGVLINFERRSQVFDYAGGSFTLTLDPQPDLFDSGVIGLCPGESATVKAVITEGRPTSVPEPGTVALLLIMLATVAGVRKFAVA